MALWSAACVCGLGDEAFLGARLWGWNLPGFMGWCASGRACGVSLTPVGRGSPAAVLLD
jgi:hypothetical protein